MKIGVLTGGGDAPGLNAVIRAVVRKSLLFGHELIGIREGWRGLLDNLYEPLDRNSVSGILHRGGTILATSRTNVYKEKDGEARVIKNMSENGIDALVAIGGEDTLGVAAKLAKSGVKVVGVPKTIDNDLNATDFTFGFDTAVNIATEAIDRLHTTAESHNRVIVVEVMGRHAGWIAAYAGIAGGADIILVPEKPFHIDEVCDIIKKRHEGGKSFSIVVASEGAKLMTDDNSDQDGSFILSSMKTDAFGHVKLGGIGNVLAEEIEKRTGYETRSTTLGHIQRGGTPTAFDRVLGTRFGVFAAELVEQGKWGYMAALKGNEIVAVKLEEAVGQLKTIDLKLMDVASTFFG
ncbi:6-phosphofructokinase [Stygiobacter electus]|uniref:Pyrophosphate--fructose 6-phosphate 1-phosphotransferase n=1 Tax=Stygiobacter electus TaxID=3032292 RepID=A0AAE3NZD5_9BACT|nr:6-phosphofructokinase [Stygiobacter electus]MDF1611517.1 6-phosphofructokinase [Stygiobacter electus]